MSNKHKIMDAIRREVGMINKVALVKAIITILILCGIGVLAVLWPVVFGTIAMLFCVGVLVSMLYIMFDDRGYSIW